MPISSRNAKNGAIALAVGALTQVAASALGVVNLPWAYAGWLVLVFGALCLCDELGAARPLNRAGLIMLAVGFVARTVMLLASDPAAIIRAELTFAIASLIAPLLWSVALMHRQDRPKAIGLLGTLLSGGGLAVLIAAHLAVAGAGYLGFAGLFAALHRPDLQPDRAMFTISVVTALWAGATASLTWGGQINARTDNAHTDRAGALDSQG